ncbi:hypothetical protein [Clostridium sp.]|uniref:hypothetical protein n=1 Tax=Clostridium sp. TaxID=1506 RepID=UPI003D6CE2F7
MKAKGTVAKLGALLLILILIVIVSLGIFGKKYKAVKPDKDPTKIVVDENYTKDVKKEKEVQSGQVYLQNGMIIGTMIVKEDVSDKDAKSLVAKYTTKLNKPYNGGKIIVKAVKKKDVTAAVVTAEKELTVVSYNSASILVNALDAGDTVKVGLVARLAAVNAKIIAISKGIKGTMTIDIFNNKVVKITVTDGKKVTKVTANGKALVKGDRYAVSENNVTIIVAAETDVVTITVGGVVKKVIYN